MSTLIESLVRRAKGTRVTMGRDNYHFKPRGSDDRHTAEVSNPAHVDRFLSISEGYREAEPLEGDTNGITAASQQPKRGQSGNTLTPQRDNDDRDDRHDEGTRVNGDGTAATAGTATIGDAVDEDTMKALAHAKGLETLPEGKAGEATDAKADADAAANGDRAAVEDDREKAVKDYIAAFGKKPHHQWSAEIIRAKLAEG